MSVTIYSPRTTDERVRWLRARGVRIEPSDAQQMLLEMIPDAMWEIVQVEEWVDVAHASYMFGIRTRVTCLTFDEGSPVGIDVLNEEKRTEELRDDHTRTPTQPVAGDPVTRPLRAARPIAR